MLLMLYSMDQLGQWGGATQVLFTHRSILSDTTDRGGENKLRIKPERDQVESFFLLILILCLSSQSGRCLTEMHADVFHFLVNLVPWLNKPKASITNAKNKK